MPSRGRGHLDRTTRDLQVTGNVPVARGSSATVVPTGATGVALNVTVVDPSGAGFLSVRPGGAAGEPLTSNVNFDAGQVAPNAVNVDLPASGQIQIWFESYAPGGTADVLVDVVGYYDDHNHDDRYYTKDQVNAAKFISLDVFTNPDVNFTEEAHADGGDSGIGGQVVNNLDIAYNLTLPPDYTAGTPLTIRLVAYSRTATLCNGDLSANFAYVTRVGVGKVGGLSLSPNNVPQQFNGADIPREYRFTLAGTSMQQGDAVTFGVFGLSSAPACDLVVTGAGVYYQ